MDQDCHCNHTLVPALWRSLRAEPATVAVYWREQAIARSQLLHKCLAMVAQLAAAGVSAGSRVAVLLPRSPDSLTVLLALWRLRAAYVPLDPTWPRARIEAALDLCTPHCLVTTASLHLLWERSACHSLLLEPIDYTGPLPEHCAVQDTVPDADASAGDPAYLLFTSGSSGTPKAVQVSHGALAKLFAGVLPLLALRPGWRLLGSSSFCFDIVFFEWLAPLLASCSLVLADEATQRNPAGLLHLAWSQRVDVIQATPSLWRLWLQEPAAAGLPALQLAIATGEALDTATARQLHAQVPALWNLYGPTECTLWCSAHRVTRAEVEQPLPCIAIGKPLPGYTFELLATPDAAPGSGELLISGAGVADGYLGAEPLQAARFSAIADGTRRFRSGDLCRRDRHGVYHFLQRCDEQLKVNGYRIEAGEIETHLRSHPGIRDAACLARTLDGGTQLLAFVCCEPGTPNKDRERWNRHLQTWLPDWMLPNRYLVLEALPLDANGKLDRRALLRLAQTRRADALQQDAGLQAEVGRIFCSVLGIAEVGPCDSFFDLGGNSMLSATLLLALNQRFATALTLREILRSPPTVLGLAARLEQAGATCTAKPD